MKLTVLSLAVVAASPALAQSDSASAPMVTASPGWSNGTVWTTVIETDYTTYCPEATTLTHQGQTYTVTEATTMTLPCPCTMTYATTPSVTPRPETASPAPSAAPSAAPAPSDTTETVVTDVVETKTCHECEMTETISQSSATNMPPTPSTSMMTPLYTSSPNTMIPMPSGSGIPSGMMPMPSPSVTGFQGAAARQGESWGVAAVGVMVGLLALL